MKSLTIKAKIIEAGYMLKDVAELAGVKPPAVTQTINGDIGSEKIRKVISNLIGVEVDDIWPKQKAPSSGQDTAVNVGTAMTVPEDGYLSQQKAG